MLSPSPTLLALDFDGVLCDGRREYFQSAWRAYRQIWPAVERHPPESLAAPFYRLRPVVETGWEMPLLLRALILAYPEDHLLQNWTTIAPQLLTAEHLTQSQLQSALDSERDAWIQADLAGWLHLHQFYPGTIARVEAAIAAGVTVVIITTKESRFVTQLLQEAGVGQPLPRIFGREQQRPKPAILRELQQQDPLASIWFVEDRLQTLQNVQQQSDLANVELFLADWGYNTAAERELARQVLPTPSSQSRRLHLLTLDQFVQPFSAWQS